MREKLSNIFADDLTDKEFANLLRTASPADLVSIARHFAEWTHEGQDAPDSDWRTWIIMAGRGFGKTRVGAEWVAAMARSYPLDDEGKPTRIALIGATIEEARQLMVTGHSGLLTLMPDEIAEWTPTKRELRFRGGAIATLFSGCSPEQLRGPELRFAWCDELAKWEKPGDTWDMLQLGLRGGEWQRVLVTTTPRAGSALRRILDEPDTVETKGSTHDNPHVSARWKAVVQRMYGGTRLGRQELEGVLLASAEGALWTPELIERCRVGSGNPPNSVRAEPVEGSSFSSAQDQKKGRASAGSARTELGDPPAHTRTLIAVDPPSGGGTCGIIAARGEGDSPDPDEMTAIILADHSVTGMTPEGWASAVADAVRIHGAEMVVAEDNQGGDMIRAVLRTAGVEVPVKPVTATSSKAARADPVSMLFEAGRVKIAHPMPDLEAQLCGLIAGGGYDGPGKSPDRADAMVWAVTELLLGEGMYTKYAPRVRGI